MRSLPILSIPEALTRTTIANKPLSSQHAYIRSILSTPGTRPQFLLQFLHAHSMHNDLLIVSLRLDIGNNGTIIRYCLIVYDLRHVAWV